jgi:hypothetical protein
VLTGPNRRVCTSDPNMPTPCRQFPTEPLLTTKIGHSQMQNRRRIEPYRRSGIGRRGARVHPINHERYLSIGQRSLNVCFRRRDVGRRSALCSKQIGTHAPRPCPSKRRQCDRPPCDAPRSANGYQGEIDHLSGAGGKPKRHRRRIIIRNELAACDLGFPSSSGRA